MKKYPPNYAYTQDHLKKNIKSKWAGLGLNGALSLLALTNATNDIPVKSITALPIRTPGKGMVIINAHAAPRSTVNTFSKDNLPLTRDNKSARR
jgi:hypothetical protein